MSDEPEPPDGDGAAERLAKYRAKRSADRTPEPFGGEEATVSPEAAAAPPVEPPAGPAWARPRLFCVQKHAATRLHYDFRVEIGGVLRSWAVPLGPSLNPADKRLAVEVEDHPVEYADFEGVIPEGNYGAGEVIVWDRGLWVALEDPAETLPRGKLTFELRGYKLRGAWHLFRTKGRGKEASKEWMLVKRADGWASATRALPPESIYSGLTLEEVRTGSERAARARAELERLGAARQEVRAGAVKLMLAETAEKPFTDPAWLFELKYDGFRVLAERDAGSRAPRLPAGERRRPHLPRDRPRPCGAALRGPRPRRRGRGARRRGPPELPAPAAAGAAAPHRRRPAGGSRDARDVLRLRPPRLRGLRPPRRSRSSSARRSCSRSCPGRGRCASSTTSPSRARPSTPR